MLPNISLPAPIEENLPPFHFKKFLSALFLIKLSISHYYNIFSFDMIFVMVFRIKGIDEYCSFKPPTYLELKKMDLL